MRVRPALPSDRAKVIETVAAAFRHDPGWGWLLGDEYERVVGSFAGTLFDLRVVCGNVWVTEDLESVAMWDAPGSSGRAQAEEAWARYRQRSGHIVQVSSIGGISAFPTVGIYHASKWALEGISQALAAEVKEFGIHVTLVEPGGFSTDWSGPSAKRSEPNPAPGDLARVAAGI